MKKFMVLNLIFFTTTAFAQTYTVEKVIDGETLQLTNGEIVSLIGVDTHGRFELDSEDLEKINRKKQERAEGSFLTQREKAAEFVKGVIPRASEVLLEFDVQEKDHYGRMLAYVFNLCLTDDERSHMGLSNDYMVPQVNAEGESVSCSFLNANIIKRGYAEPLTIPPNVKYAELFEELYHDARENRRGLWEVKQDGMPCNTENDCNEFDCSQYPTEAPKNTEEGFCAFNGNRICWEGKCICQLICT